MQTLTLLSEDLDPSNFYAAMVRFNARLTQASINGIISTDEYVGSHSPKVATAWIFSQAGFPAYPEYYPVQYFKALCQLPVEVFNADPVYGHP